MMEGATQPATRREAVRGRRRMFVKGTMPDRFDVLGVRVSAVDLASATARIRRAVQDRATGYVCVTGAHGIMESLRDEDLGRIHNESLLTVPDGMPLVWVARRRGVAGVGRVYGPDLMRRVLGSGEPGDGSRESAEAGQELDAIQRPPSALRSPSSRLVPHPADLAPPPPVTTSHFLLGSTAEVLARLADRIGSDFPCARIAGTWSPPFRDLTDDEWHDALRRVRESGASIVWVGLSTPKQERFMAGFVRRWDAGEGKRDSGAGRRDAEVVSARPPPCDPAPLPSDPGSRTSDLGSRSSVVLIGVGAAFDVLAGLRADAPGWVKRCGLQWFHRLLQEPRRLGRRYLGVVPGFLWRILPDLILGGRGR